jgi:hypothetical protein
MNIWIISKNKLICNQFLSELGVNSIEDLNQNNGHLFPILLFFEFFKKQDSVTQINAYRDLKL